MAARNNIGCAGVGLVRVTVGIATVALGRGGFGRCSGHWRGLVAIGEDDRSIRRNRVADKAEGQMEKGGRWKKITIENDRWAP